jgi:MinD superfamily P-loop ATPase
MRNTLFYIGGTKGGVGKSFVAMALIDLLIMEYYGKKQIMLIETDFTQPDVAKMYSKKIPTETIVLDETENAWMKLGRVIYENQDKLMVMNTAKGNAGINPIWQNVC